MLGLGGTLSSLLKFWLSSMTPLSVTKEVCSTLLPFLSISLSASSGLLLLSSAIPLATNFYFVIHKIGSSLSLQ